MKAIGKRSVGLCLVSSLWENGRRREIKTGVVEDFKIKSEPYWGGGVWRLGGARERGSGLGDQTYLKIGFP